MRWLQRALMVISTVMLITAAYFQWDTWRINRDLQDLMAARSAPMRECEPGIVLEPGEGCTMIFRIPLDGDAKNGGRI